MKLASLKGPTRDGSLLLVNENLTRAVSVLDIAPTMQYALEHWRQVEAQLLNEFEAIDAGTSRPIIDFQKALAENRLAAPLPRTHQWLDGSAYLSHVERVRRARNDKVPESFYTEPLMYQGGGDSMLGPRDDIEIISEDWGADLEGEVGVITGDVKMGATPAEAALAVRLVGRGIAPIAQVAGENGGNTGRMRGRRATRRIDQRYFLSQIDSRRTAKRLWLCQRQGPQCPLAGGRHAGRIGGRLER